MTEEKKTRFVYNIVSTTGFLIGVRKDIFEKESEPLKLDIYNRLVQDKRSRIIRNLCYSRNRIILWYSTINRKRRDSFGYLSIPEFPANELDELEKDGVKIYSQNLDLRDYLFELNKAINARINDCREFYPDWIEWDYIRGFFIMPDGTVQGGPKNALDIFWKNVSLYPYQVYCNWKPEEAGNIFFNDKKFVEILYRQNGEEFTDLGKVSDAGASSKRAIGDFIEESGKTVFVVDCENSDPFRLYTAINGLPKDIRAKISKIIMYNDINASNAWELLKYQLEIPVEEILTERIRPQKSLVDISLAAGTCREFYTNEVDSFVLVSSDSDYWGLIKSIPEANFLVMAEREKVSFDLKGALLESDIYYCFIEDFYSGADDTLLTAALIKASKEYLEKAINLNVNDMMDDILKKTRANMTSAQIDSFKRNYITPMHLKIDDSGDVSVILGKR